MKIKPNRHKITYSRIRTIKHARKVVQGMSDMIERDCIDSDINSALPDETMSGNSRDEFQRHRLADVDCIGLRNIQTLKLFIRTRIRGKSELYWQIYNRSYRKI